MHVRSTSIPCRATACPPSLLKPNTHPPPSLNLSSCAWRVLLPPHSFGAGGSPGRSWPWLPAPTSSASSTTSRAGARARNTKAPSAPAVPHIRTRTHTHTQGGGGSPTGGGGGVREAAAPAGRRPEPRRLPLQPGLRLPQVLACLLARLLPTVITPFLLPTCVSVCSCLFPLGLSVPPRSHTAVLSSPWSVCVVCVVTLGPVQLGACAGGT
jgi:hypothetical protein